MCWQEVKNWVTETSSGQEAIERYYHRNLLVWLSTASTYGLQFVHRCKFHTFIRLFNLQQVIHSFVYSFFNQSFIHSLIHSSTSHSFIPLFILQPVIFIHSKINCEAQEHLISCKLIRLLSSRSGDSFESSWVRFPFRKGKYLSLCIGWNDICNFVISGLGFYSVEVVKTLITLDQCRLLARKSNQYNRNLINTIECNKKSGMLTRTGPPRTRTRTRTWPPRNRTRTRTSWTWPPKDKDLTPRTRTRTWNMSLRSPQGQGRGQGPQLDK